MRVKLVLEIQTVVLLHDVECLFMSIVFEYELLEVKERSLVVHSLPDLHL